MYRVLAAFKQETGYRVKSCEPVRRTDFDPFKCGQLLAFVSVRAIRKGHFVNPTKIMREMFVAQREADEYDKKPPADPHADDEHILARHDFGANDGR